MSGREKPQMGVIVVILAVLAAVFSGCAAFKEPVSSDSITQAETPASEKEHETALPRVRVVIRVPCQDPFKDWRDLERHVQTLITASSLYVEGAVKAGLIDQNTPPEERNEMARDLASRVTVSTLDYDGSNGWLFTLEYADANPEKAERIMKALVPELVRLVNKPLLEDRVRRTRNWPGKVTDRSLEEARAELDRVSHELAILAHELGLEYDPITWDASYVFQTLKNKFRELNSDVLAKELTLAKKKKLLEVLQDRIVSEQRSAQESAENDPILKELAILLGLAEKDYKRTANMEGVDEKQLDEKKKTLTETRLALLRRKEKLNQEAVQGDMAKARDEMIQIEKEIAELSVELENSRNSLPGMKKRLVHWETLWANNKDIVRKQVELREEYIGLSELMRTPAAYKATVVQGAALVVETAE